MTPAVSVVLNSYNHARYLRECVESVIAQTLGDWELIAIDNGSTDGSAEILRDYGSGDQRIRLSLHTLNEPVTKRLNEGVMASRAPLVTFLYSDDIYLPRKLEVQVREMAHLDESYGVVYSPPRILLEDGQVREGRCLKVSGWVFANLLRRHFEGQIDMVSPMFRRDCLLLHPFNEEIFAEGEAVLFRVALSHQFHFLDEPLVLLRDHSANAGKAVRWNADMTFAALDRLVAHPLVSREDAELVERFRAQLMVRYAWQELRRDADGEWARQVWVDGLRRSPRVLRDPRTAAAGLMALLPRVGRRRINNFLDGRTSVSRHSA